MSEPNENQADETYSISLRLRRVTYEDAYVSVPVTDAVVRTEADGSRHLDGQAVFDEGLKMAADPRVEWRHETTEVEVHTEQTPRPDDRRTYDPFIDDDRSKGEGYWRP